MNRWILLRTCSSSPHTQSCHFCFLPWDFLEFSILRAMKDKYLYFVNHPISMILLWKNTDYKVIQILNLEFKIYIDDHFILATIRIDRNMYIHWEMFWKLQLMCGEKWRHNECNLQNKHIIIKYIMRVWKIMIIFLLMNVSN